MSDWARKQFRTNQSWCGYTYMVSALRKGHGNIVHCGARRARLDHSRRWKPCRLEQLSLLRTGRYTSSNLRDDASTEAFPYVGRLRFSNSFLPLDMKLRICRKRFAMVSAGVKLSFWFSSPHTWYRNLQTNLSPFPVRPTLYIASAKSSGTDTVYVVFISFDMYLISRLTCRGSVPCDLLCDTLLVVWWQLCLRRLDRKGA